MVFIKNVKYVQQLVLSLLAPGLLRPKQLCQKLSLVTHIKSTVVLRYVDTAQVVLLRS